MTKAKSKLIGTIIFYNKALADAKKTNDIERALHYSDALRKLEHKHHEKPFTYNFEV